MSDARKWRIFTAGASCAYYALDRVGALGEQDVANFKFYELLLAPLPEGRLRPCRGEEIRGAKSKIPRASCQGNPTFSPDEVADESYSFVSLRHEGLRVLFGQEVDRERKRSNVALNRRADC